MNQSELDEMLQQAAFRTSPLGKKSNFAMTVGGAYTQDASGNKIYDSGEITDQSGQNMFRAGTQVMAKVPQVAQSMGMGQGMMQGQPEMQPGAPQAINPPRRRPMGRPMPQQQAQGQAPDGSKLQALLQRIFGGQR